MTSFHAGGRDWKIRLTVGLLGTIKRETGLELAGMLTDGERFADILFADPPRLVAALWIACEEQAAIEGVTPAQWQNFFGGEEIDLAMEAIIEAAVDFFPKARGREAMKRAIPTAMAKMAAASNQAIAERLSTFSATVGSSPGSLESIPAN